MVFRRRSPVSKDEAGFTLIEVLIAVAIAGIIGGGVTAGTIHIATLTSRNTDHTVAVKQIRNAVYWIRRDAKMAQTVQVDGGASGLPLILTWVRWDNTEHEVTYALEGGSLKRSHSIDGGQPSGLLVAQFIDPDPALTNCQFTGGILTFELTAVVGSGAQAATESLIFRVDPRPSQ